MLVTLPALISFKSYIRLQKAVSGYLEEAGFLSASPRMSRAVLGHGRLQEGPLPSGQGIDVVVL